MKSIINLLLCVVIYNQSVYGKTTQKSKAAKNKTSIDNLSKSKVNVEKVNSLSGLTLTSGERTAPATSHALSLSDVYRSAYDTDSRMASAQNSLEASHLHFDADYAKTWGPTLSLTAGLVLGQKWVAPTSFGIVNGWTTSGGLTLTQPLFNYVQILQKDQSEYAISVEEVRNAVAQQDLMVRVTKAYLDVLKLQSSIEFKNTEIKAAGTHLEIVKEQVAVGLATQGDLSEAEAIVEGAKAQKSNLESLLTTAKGVLLQTWQISSNELKHLKSKILFKAPVPSDPQKWIDQAVLLNLNVQYNSGLQEIAEYDIEKAKAALNYPIVNLTAGCTVQGTADYPFGGDTQNINGCSGGVQVSMPLFDGGYTPAKSKELTAIKERIRNEVRTSQIFAGQASRQAFADINKELTNIQLYQKAVAGLTDALEGKRQNFLNGDRKSFEILTTLQNLNIYKQQLLTEKYDFIYNKVLLKQSVGLLTVVDLEEIDALLE